MNDELKPCPFCGGEAHVYEWPDVGGLFTGEQLDPPMFSVACKDCEAGFVPTYERSKAIAAWNARTPALTEQVRK